MRYVYLAGPMTGLTYESAVDWREHATDTLRGMGWTALSPMRNKEHLAGTVLKGVFDEGAAAVQRDIFDIRRSQVVIANFTDATLASVGTCVELGFAYALNKHIVTVIPSWTASKAGVGRKKQAANPHDHVFPLTLSSLVVSTIELALEWVEAL